MKQLCIGVHCYEQPERLRKTLESLRRNTASTVQLTLLADGPDVRMRQALQGLDDIPQSGTAEPSGMAACFNRLANSTKAGIVVLLESGAQVGPSWLDHLLAALDSDPGNGLAGPSTNNSWNEQCVFPRSGNNPAEIATTAMQAEAKFGNEVRTLEPLYSLADFCYAVRREVIDAIGLADEGFGCGPCWEMDYNIRAARAGWRGVWVCGAYVHRASFTQRRRIEEARLFESSKRRYQDKFCGARLRGAKTDYRSHCRGDACPNFAPASLIRVRESPAPAVLPIDPALAVATPIAVTCPCQASPASASGIVSEEMPPLVTCIMPTCDRHRFVPEALRCFLRQDYPSLELVIVDDGEAPIAGLPPDDGRIRLIRLPAKKKVGAKRNVACAAAHGEFIIHWDDDDWYPADRVRRQIAALQTGRTDICGTSTLYYYDASGGRAWRYRYADGRRSWVAGNTLAYRTSWWAAHPFPEIQVGEDTRFVTAAPASSVCDLGDPRLCVARVHRGNTSRKHMAGRCWSPSAAGEIESVLGEDWPSFLAVGNDAAPIDTVPLVSCIMPTFNRRRFLPLALETFRRQDYARKELIVVDDGTDGVGELVAGVPDVRYVRLPGRISIGEKRNRACVAAQGDIIAHWDDDDWYSPARLRQQIAPLLTDEADLTGLQNSCVLELSEGRFWGTSEALHRRMFVGDVHGGTLVFWKRLLAEGLRYPSTNIAEDGAFIQAALRRGKRLTRVPNEGVFVYVRHGGNAWRFQAGRFIDPNGWKTISSPQQFPAAELALWQQAAGVPCAN